MRIHPDLLNATVFLCADVPNKDGSGMARQAAATGFFVEVPNDKNPSLSWTYVVTARHCIRDRKATDTIYIRVNTAVSPPSDSVQKYIDIPTRPDRWFTDKDADVAAFPLPVEGKYALSYRAIKLHWFVSADHKFRPTGPEFDQRLRRLASDGLPIYVGDQLFFTGLFAQSAGTKSNLPIVRFGNISRMPQDEPVNIHSEVWGDDAIRAYLAECHSWGGHSGSPAFWHWEYSQARPVLIGPNEYENALTARSWVMALLGLVSGHFDIPSDAKQANGISTNLNAGIAIITPAEDIRRLLMENPLVLQDREDRREAATIMR